MVLALILHRLFFMITVRSFTLKVAFLLLTACTLGSNQAAATPTPKIVEQTLPSPITGRTLQAIPSQSPVPAYSSTPKNNCEAAQDNTYTVRHTVVADVYYHSHRVIVEQRTQFVNRTLQSLDEIVFNVEANRMPNTFSLIRVATGPDELAYVLNGKKLLIDLNAPLGVGCTITLTIDFTLDILSIASGAFAAKGYLAYTERQMNLGHWLPTVAVLDGTQWITREAFLIGEQEVLDVADWRVTLNLVEGADTVTVAAPGIISEISPASWHYELQNARDFSVSLSEHFNFVRHETDRGISVELYSFANPSKLKAVPHALDVASRSLSLYEDQFGLYPYERMVIVQGDFPDGMEFSGLVFVGNTWFTRYPDDPASYLTLITVHEVSHQWWYARVGNDPARHPWLDEALATYSEYLFLETHYPQLTSWWWSFRVDIFRPQGYVDSDVYQFSSGREYINAVYLQGVRMLHEIRGILGDDAFFQLLRDYAEAGDSLVATPAHFWSQMTPEQRALTEAIRRDYLRQPNIFNGES